MPQFSILPQSPLNKSNNNNKPITKTIRKYKEINTDEFNKDLCKIDWHTDEIDDTNQYTTNFLHVFNEVLDNHAPKTEVKITKKQAKKKAKPWISKEILKLINKKDNIYRKFLKEKNPDKKQELYNKYKKMKNEITKTIRTSKKQYYNEYFNNHSTNIKKLWVGVNQIINKKHQSSTGPMCIEVDIDGNVHTVVNPQEIANAFNSHYASVASKILQKRKYPGKKQFQDYLKNSNSKTFMINPTTPAEVEKAISEIDTSKSTGPNSIPNQLLQSIKKSISLPLSIMINKSFQAGHCPDILKSSIVIPVHKKDSRLIVANYRPISLLSNINKIVEKLMFKRLYHFLESNKCLYDMQFGFRQKHSTNHALLSMCQQIRDTINKGNLAVGVFVDFQKSI